VEQKDSEIIDEILKGDKEKYALLMRKYNQRLYRICKGYLKDEDEIENVMQDTYVKAYLNLKKFENRSQFLTWLTRIGINECLQHLRKTGKINLMDTSEETNEIMNTPDNNDPEKQSMNKELKELLELAIANLPEKYRAVFIMREIERMSVEETSEAMEITQSNVKIRLNRAKEMLRSTILNNYPMENIFEFNLVRCDRIAQNVLARI
jgi:RNA polymerase sigma factor (sigma-70 family)